MAQHDLVIENGAGFTVRQDINAALAALGSLQSGSVSPTTTTAYQWWADTGTGLLKQRNADNSAWLVRGSLSDTVTVARTSNTTLTAGDYGKTVVATGTWTQTIAAVSSIGAGWWVAYRNNGTGTITIDPSGSETIDGSSAITLSAGESCLIVCSGGALVTVGRATLRLSASNPLADGTATPGATGQAADAGHVHPTDTTRAAAVHGHAISDVSGLQAALDGKMPADAVVAPPRGMQIITASGPFIVPDNVTAVKVRGCGGGSGGGHVPGAGGTTSFGSHCSATGGNGETPGTGTGGDINLAGGKGGKTGATSGNVAAGGAVGGGYGGGGVTSADFLAAPTGLLGGSGHSAAAATGYGNGGGTSTGSPITLQLAGSAGGYFEKYITGLTPGSSITVTIGAAGTAGASGKGGAPGICIVEW